MGTCGLFSSIIFCKIHFKVMFVPLLSRSYLNLLMPGFTLWCISGVRELMARDSYKPGEGSGVSPNSYILGKGSQNYQPRTSFSVII